MDLVGPEPLAGSNRVVASNRDRMTAITLRIRIMIVLFDALPYGGGW
jgi:hypothetical protein